MWVAVAAHAKLRGYATAKSPVRKEAKPAATCLAGCEVRSLMRKAAQPGSMHPLAVLNEGRLGHCPPSSPVTLDWMLLAARRPASCAV